MPPHLRVGGSDGRGGGAGAAGSAGTSLGRSRVGEEGSSLGLGAGRTTAGSPQIAGGASDDPQISRGAWGRGTAPLRARPKPQQRSSSLRSVEVDSLVIMKILKHWRDFYPVPVNGQLLGSETLDKLEITNCFPLPQKKEVLAALQQEKLPGDIEERVDEEFDRYQDKMTELMHDVSVDCFTVGWYQTLAFTDLQQKEVLESLVAYQELVDKAVMICFDAQRHGEACNAFKAYRVSPDFLHRFHIFESDVTQYSKLSPSDILVEVPLVVHNAFLTEACLLNSPNGLNSLASENLCWGFQQSSTMERGMNEIATCLDVLGEEQEKIQRYQRDSLKQQQLHKQLTEKRRLENEQRRLRGEPLLPPEIEGSSMRQIDPPSLLPSLLLQSQTTQHTDDVSRACADGLSKLFLLNYASQAAKESFE